MRADALITMLLDQMSDMLIHQKPTLHYTNTLLGGMHRLGLQWTLIYLIVVDYRCQNKIYYSMYKFHGQVYIFYELKRVLQNKLEKCLELTALLNKLRMRWWKLRGVHVPSGIWILSLLHAIHICSYKMLSLNQSV